LATETTETTEVLLDRDEGLDECWRLGVSPARVVIKIQTNLSVVSVVSVAKNFGGFCG
jgi:mRNA-degrading endonuclease RelE of RelBE toxin-antitoxin system